MKLKKKILGKIDFEGTVDVTDPCYDEDTWCRLNNIILAPGEHTCIMWEGTESFLYNGKVVNETNVAKIGIYLDGIVPKDKDMITRGFIGVDAGLAGFFHKKPDYSDDEWSEFCDRIKVGDAWLWEDEKAFFSSSGYGDGEYIVKALIKDGIVRSMEIRFTV